MPGCRAAALLLVFAVGLSAAGQAEIRVCISKGNAEDCRRELNTAYGEGDGENSLTFTCTRKLDNECLEDVKTGNSDVTIVGGNELFAAHNQYGLAAIVAEETVNGDGDASYYGVALVKKSQCVNDFAFPSDKLKGLKVCSTGYRKTAGWILPMGKMLRGDIVPDVDEPTKDVNRDAFRVAEFFNNTICAPRTTSDGPKIVDGNPVKYDELCSGCNNPADCSTADQYYGYTGALQCMLEGNGTAVAFVKHSTVADYIEEIVGGNPKDRPSLEDLGVNKTDISILCEDGCKDLYDGEDFAKQGDTEHYKLCMTGKNAANSMVTRQSFVGSNAYNYLLAAMDLSGDDPAPADVDDGLTDESDLGLWSSDTEKLIKRQNPLDAAAFELDFFSAYDDFRAIRNLDLKKEGYPVKVCVPRKDDASLLERCNDVMNLQYGTSDIHFECLEAENAEACLKGIDERDFDITTVGGNELYAAHEEHRLEPLVAEIYEGTDDTASYYGVGIVKADQCGPGKQFTGLNRESLQGKDSCHTGYRKTAGWTLPIGTLLDQGIMPRVLDPEGKVNADAYSVSSFFNRVCAPRTVADGPTSTSGESYVPLCDLCAEATDEGNECEGGNQDINPYYDFTGAFKCMDAGNSRVAWVKHTTFDDYKKETGLELRKRDYRILCTDGCFPLDDFDRPECQTGQSASQAVVVRPDFPHKDAVKDALMEYKVAAMEIAGLRNFFWSFSTVRIKDVGDMEFENDFFTSYSRFNALFNLETTVRVCISSGTASECEDELNEAYGDSLRYQCQRVASDEQCLKRIADREADVTVVGGNELFLAHEVYGLTAYVAEGVSDGIEDASYYGVAAVKDSKCNDGVKFDKATLQGMRACSTGYRKTAGWVMPMGKILQFEGVQASDPSSNVNVDAYSIGEFFKEGICSPRTVAGGPRKDGTNYEKLCALCKNKETCSDDDDEYYGYSGAFQCMMDDAGDVAFVKHTTADNEGVDKEGLRLLCTDGCKEWNDDNAKLPECTTGKSASNALVARKDYANTRQLQQLLEAFEFNDDNESQKLPGDVTNEDEVGFWSQKTAKLFKIEDPQDFESFFTAYDRFKTIHDSDKEAVNVCITSGNTDRCESALHQAYGQQLKFECSKEDKGEDCLKAIKEGTADLSVVGGQELFLAHNQYDLAAYVAENSVSSIGTASYIGVAVVKKSQCDDRQLAFTKDKLQELSVCSTGYRKTAGWVLPVGKLIDKGFLDESDRDPDGLVNADAWRMASFFQEICSPRVTSNGPKINENGQPVNYEDLCSICENKAECSNQDQYYDYTGALQCMIDDEGDVAFVKQSTYEDYVAEIRSGNDKGRSDAYDKTQYKLLCDSGCKDWTDANAKLKECMNGESASNALVGRKSFVDSPQHDILMRALGFTRSKLTVEIETGTTFRGAAAAVRDKDEVGFWSSSTATLTRLLDPETDEGFKEFFSAYSNFKAIRDTDLPSGEDVEEVRVCVPFDDNTLVSKCTEVMNVQYGGTFDGIKVSFKCYNGRSSDGCMKRIDEGTDHLTIFGGNELFLAHELYGLEAYVAESTDGSSTATYYGVAVVKADKCGEGKAFTGFNRESLQGKKSCHTGYRKTAGWVLPVGKLLKDNVMPLTQDPSGLVNADAYSVSRFFSKVCAPRTVSGGPSKDGSTYAPLCELCGEADGVTNSCAGDQGANPYYDYTGAFRCMDEDTGDVAFVKHTTREDFERENGVSRPVGNYKILCDDGCADYTEANWKLEKCITGESATNAVVAKADFTVPDVGKAAVNSLINGGNVRVAAKTINSNRNFFWGMSTTSVKNVEGQTFNNEFFQAYENFREIRISDMSTVRVCISGGDEDKCKRALTGAYGSNSLMFTCTKKNSDEECLQSIKNGEADVTVVGGNELFAAHNQYNLAAIVAEKAAGSVDDAAYYSVPLVKTSRCNNKNWQRDRATLQGMKICSTGYRRTAGWWLPVGFLFDKDIVEKKTDPNGLVNQDAFSLGEFFTEGICSPRTVSGGPKVDTDGNSVNYDKLCSICKDSKTTCNDGDEYTRYVGALQCMLDGTDDGEEGGDVAFVKQDTVEEWLDNPNYDNDFDEVDGVNNRSEIAILCDDGCEPLYNSNTASDFAKDSNGVENFRLEKCTMGKNAANAMVARKSFVSTDSYNSLMTAMSLGGATTEAAVDDGLTTEGTVGLFSSGTKMLIKLSDAADDAGFKSFFSAYNNFREIRNSDFVGDDEVKVCVPRIDEELRERCEDVMNVQYGTSDLKFTCGTEENAEACMQEIKDGKYDITTFGGNELFRSHKDFDLEALVAEIYITGEPASYFGVGVVKASVCGEGRAFTGRNKASLQNKDSCHTGYRKTAGWMLPVGKLLEKEILEAEQDPSGEVRTDAYTVSQFFKRVCAPREVAFGPRIGGGTWDPLCELCGTADGVVDKCAGGSQDINPYYDYTGAFQCMLDGPEDDPRVAWVKHTTWEDYNKQNPANPVRGEDFKLLCDDGCEDWTEANYKLEKCNNGESASQAVVARAGFKDTGKGGKVLQALYNGGAVKVAAKEIAGQQNFFWSASTQSTRDVSGQDFQGDFFKAYTGFEKIIELDQPDTTVRVCISSGSESGCESALNDAYGGSSTGITFSCTLASNDKECLENVENQRQDITVVGGNELFLANSEHNLVAYVAEVVDVDLGDASYFGVAAVKRSTCSGSNVAFNRATLQSLVACSTGYRKTAGWVLPVGNMLDDDDIMPRRADPAGEVNADAFSMAKFFRQGVCSPRTTADGPMVGGGKYDELCTACSNPQDCSNGDEYYGYGGALKCMLDHDGRVAFVKHTTADDEGANKGDLQLLCRNGCRDWTDANAKSSACTTGKSASKALVARKDFDSTKRNSLLRAMGLGSSETANIGANMSNRRKDALLSDNAGFWSKDTKQLKKLTATDSGFRDFFSAYDSFREIRASENYEDDVRTSSNIKLRLSGVDDEILDGQGSNDLASRQEFNNWVGGVEDALEEMLKESCNEDGGSGCSAITVTVTSVTKVSSRRSLLASTVDVESRASGSSASNSKKVTDQIRSSRSITIGGISYGASNAEAIGLDTTSPTPSPTSSPSRKSDGLYDGGVAGVAIGVFFGGVFVTLIVWYFVSKRKGGGLPGCVQQSSGSFQRMEEMKYNEYNNPTSSYNTAPLNGGPPRENGASKESGGASRV